MAGCQSVPDSTVILVSQHMDALSSELTICQK